MAECQEHTEHVLRAAVPEPAAAVAARYNAPAVACECGREPSKAIDDFNRRPRAQYLTVRPQEDVTVLIGARASVAESVELLEWKRIFEGKYKPKKKKGRPSQGKTALAYSRVLIAKITCHKPVGYMGREINVAVVHLHNKVANKDKGFKLRNRLRVDREPGSARF